MAEYTTLYHLAHYYDVAFRRDVSDQIAFFSALFERHTGRPLGSLLDIACGPGYHAIAAAQMGMRGVGLDLMPEMIEYAQTHMPPGIEVEWIAADMREFQLSAPVDMAISLFDSIDALTKNADVIRHFRSVANNLSPDGLYLIQHTHPRDCNLSYYPRFHYGGERDGTRVEVEWAVNSPTFNLVDEVAHVDIELHIFENGGEQVIYDSAVERIFSPQEFQLLADASGRFEIVDWFGGFKLDQPFDVSPLSETMILVMQRKG